MTARAPPARVGHQGDSQGGSPLGLRRVGTVSLALDWAGNGPRQGGHAGLSCQYVSQWSVRRGGHGAAVALEGGSIPPVDLRARTEVSGR